MDPEIEAMRTEFVSVAVASLVQGETAQYWTFWRGDLGPDGPLLVIAKPGRRVVHIKRVPALGAPWKFIEAEDPVHIGDAYEIRLGDGAPDEVRAAFQAGLAALLAVL